MDPKKRLINWRLAMGEGIFSAIMTGFTQDYFVPFILLLGATVRQVGFLSALPNLFAALVQIKSTELADFIGSRKKTIVFNAILQIVFLGVVVAMVFSGVTDIWAFIGLAVLFTIAGALLSPSYASILIDFVGEGKQGEYMGWRNKVVGFVMIAGSLVAGSFLYYSKASILPKAFGLLFLAALMFRIISLFFLLRIEEKPLPQAKDAYFSLSQFFGRFKESNFAKFVIFSSLMQFTANLASPFFSVHMLRDLGFDYITYTVVTIASTATIYIMMQRWGHHADITGNLTVLRFVSPLIGIVPLLWILDRHPVYLIFAQIFSGFVWAGYTLCTGNFIYDAVTPQKRTRCIAYFNFCNGIAICLGAFCGGFILGHLPKIFGYQFLTLCLISGILRLLVGVFFPPFIKEVRSVKNIKAKELFLSVVGLKVIR